MNKNIKMKRILSCFIIIIFTTLSLFNFSYAATTNSSIIKSPGVLSNVTYKLKPNVHEINLKEIGLSDYMIKTIKSKLQNQYTIYINKPLEKNSIYLDKTANIPIKILNITSRNNFYEVTLEVASLTEVFDDFQIPEQNVGIKAENIVKSSVPENVEYSTKVIEDLESGDIHNFEFDDYTVPETDIKIDGEVVLVTPKILTELKWNKNFKVDLFTGEEVDIKISGKWNFDSDSKKLLLSNIEVPSDDGIGKLYAGLYVDIHSNGQMELSADINQSLDFSSSIEGDLKFGVDPLNIQTDYNVEKNLVAQVESENVTNSYFPIELYAGLDILGEEIKVVCTMGMEVSGNKVNNTLYVDINGRCIGTAYIFGKTIILFDKTWDIYDYTIQLAAIISFIADRTNISKYQTVKLSWETQNSQDITITTSRGNKLSNLKPSGSIMITPNITMTFTLTVIDEYGNYTTKDITVFVN